MIQLPNNEKCYNLPEQVAQNLLNIKYLAEQYANIDSLPTVWKAYKDEFDEDLDTFGDWTTTFEGWESTLSTYLANMSSAAVGAIAGHNIAPDDVAATGNITCVNLITSNNITCVNLTTSGNITGASIIEDMLYYSYEESSPKTNITFTPVYAGVVKNGNKITFAWAGTLERTGDVENNYVKLCSFGIPSAVGSKLYPNASYGSGIGQIVAMKSEGAFSNYYSDPAYANSCLIKNSNASVSFAVTRLSNLTLNTVYSIRLETTLLLSDNLAE